MTWQQRWVHCDRIPFSCHHDNIMLHHYFRAWTGWLQVRMLLANNFVPNLSPGAALVSNDFRAQRLYCEDCDNLLKKHQAALKALYSRSGGVDGHSDRNQRRLLHRSIVTLLNDLPCIHDLHSSHVDCLCDVQVSDEASGRWPSTKDGQARRLDAADERCQAARHAVHCQRCFAGLLVEQDAGSSLSSIH